MTTFLEETMREFREQFYDGVVENLLQPRVDETEDEFKRRAESFLLSRTTAAYELGRAERTKEVLEMVKFLGKEQIEIYSGKLPFVVMPNKADEGEKIAIYRQALSDLSARLIK